MAIGIAVTQDQLNNLIGNAGRDFLGLSQRTRNLTERLALFSDADLAALSYQPADVTAIRSFCMLANQLCGVFDGTQAITEPQNFLAALSPIIGAGL